MLKKSIKVVGFDCDSHEGLRQDSGQARDGKGKDQRNQDDRRVTDAGSSAYPVPVS